MGKWFITVLVLGGSSLAHAQSTSFVEACQSMALNASFPNGGVERSCQQNLDLPSAFLVKCLRWVSSDGFPSPTDELACRHFCASNENWGPWYDFILPREMFPNLLRMKALHDAGRCLN